METGTEMPELLRNSANLVSNIVRFFWKIKQNRSEDHLRRPEIQLLKERKHNDVLCACAGDVSERQSQTFEVPEGSGIEDLRQVRVRRFRLERQLLRTDLLLL